MTNINKIILDEMTVDELTELLEKISRKLAIKSYSNGFKDGFNDCKRAEYEKTLFDAEKEN
jgi:hypothetical protein